MRLSTIGAMHLLPSSAHGYMRRLNAGTERLPITADPSSRRTEVGLARTVGGLIRPISRDPPFSAWRRMRRVRAYRCPRSARTARRRSRRRGAIFAARRRPGNVRLWSIPPASGANGSYPPAVSANHSSSTIVDLPDEVLPHPVAAVGAQLVVQVVNVTRCGTAGGRCRRRCSAGPRREVQAPPAR